MRCLKLCFFESSFCLFDLLRVIKSKAETEIALSLSKLGYKNSSGQRFCLLFPLIFVLISLLILRRMSTKPNIFILKRLSLIFVQVCLHFAVLWIPSFFFHSFPCVPPHPPSPFWPILLPDSFLPDFTVLTPLYLSVKRFVSSFLFCLKLNLTGSTWRSPIAGLAWQTIHPVRNCWRSNDLSVIYLSHALRFFVRIFGFP